MTNEHLGPRIEKLSSWLTATLSRPVNIDKITRLSGGKSNPTFRIFLGNDSIILRKRPAGKLLRSAHAVDREFTVMSALHSVGFPVPTPLAYCADRSILGTDFYVMQFVAGRTFWNGQLPELSAVRRSAIYTSLISNLAQLHNLRTKDLGLDDFGAKGSYFERQIARWSGQLTKESIDKVPSLGRLGGFLNDSVPNSELTTLVHGDYRIDNLIFDGEEDSIAATIDWELSTIGDPIADFSYLLLSWLLPQDGRAGLLAGDGELPAGVPTLETCCSLYCDLTNRASIRKLDWYFSYNFFRLACIVQGVILRESRSDNSQPKSGATWKNVSDLADKARFHAQRVGYVL